MNKLLVMAFLAFAISGFSQDVYYTLTNPRDVEDNGMDYHMIDILTYSNEGFKLGFGQLYINYDSTTFGANVFNNNNLEILVSENSILNQKVGSPPSQFDYYGNFITNDNTALRFSFSWQHDYSNACMDTVNVDYFSGIVVTLKLKYKDGQLGNPTGICLEGGQNYSNQTFTACGPSDCNTNDCFNYPGIQLLSDSYQCSDCRIVYTNKDSGQGSLREAILCATANDTIRFAQNLEMDTISISSSELALNKSLSILSNPNIGITVSGTSTDRVFNVLLGNQIIIEGLSMIGGAGLQGDCILNLGTLSLKNLTLLKGNGDSHLLNLGNLSIVGNVELKE